MLFWQNLPAWKADLGEDQCSTAEANARVAGTGRRQKLSGCLSGYKAIGTLLCMTPAEAILP